MKNGDLVRFWFGRGHAPPEKVIGLLIEYNTWEKVATVLHEGKIYRIRAENVQKAGKKDAIRKD